MNLSPCKIFVFIGYLLFWVLHITTIYNGIPKCKKTQTLQFVQQNIYYYFDPKTKCRHVQLFYYYPFSAVATTATTNTANNDNKWWSYKYVTNTIYSIKLCDKKKHDGIVGKPISNPYILYLHSHYPREYNRLNSVYEYISIVSYYYSGIYKYETQMVINDISVCFYGVINPCFQLLICICSSSVWFIYFILPQKKLKN